MTGEAAAEPARPVQARRQFQLPEDDVEALDAFALLWETIVVAGTQWLLVHGWSLPAGLSADRVTIAIRMVPGYPAAALDMVYVNPPLQRTDGRSIPALSSFMLDGVVYQQWSRHYTSANPWRVGTDSVATHLRAADEWFRRAVS